MKSCIIISFYSFTEKILDNWNAQLKWIFFSIFLFSQNILLRAILRLLLCAPSILLVHSAIFLCFENTHVTSLFYLLHSFILVIFSAFSFILVGVEVLLSSLVELQVLRYYVSKWWLVWLLMVQVSCNFCWI